MQDFFKDFKQIIRNCNYTNTYKMALAKSLVEISVSFDIDREDIEITMEEIAFKFLKYYWNQTIFFDLRQGSNLIEIPIIVQYTKSLINKYYIHVGHNRPIRFEKVEDYLEENLNLELKNCILKIADGLCKDVIWRFTYLNGTYNDHIYIFDKKKNVITIKRDNLNILKNNAEDLYDLINYKWGMILETFNDSPRINKKVRIIDEQGIQRTNLNKFKDFLDLENPKHICFICGERILEENLSIDHIIPWSYLYSDDIWNLVYVHKSCNSIKNNRIPSKEEIEKLKLRNNNLLKRLEKKKIAGKMFNELKIAIDKNYVDKFWVGCK